MAIVVQQQRALSIERALRGLAQEQQQLIQERYTRLLPVLLLLMGPHDIYERNRTWLGTSPVGNVATS